MLGSGEELWLTMSGINVSPLTGTKICTRCKENKHFNAFQRIKDSHYSQCKKCAYQTAKECKWRNPEKTRRLWRERYKKNPEALLKKQLRQKFGLSLEKYKNMIIAQDNRCVICAEPERALGTQKDGRVRRLAVDHCHETGVVRGLLCVHCNAGLGHFRDDILLMGRAMEYLANSRRGG